jgi:hypothetical protein
MLFRKPPPPPPPPELALPDEFLVLCAMLLLLFLPSLAKSSNGGALLAVYFGLGVAVYSHLEGWDALDACYFMVVTATTVGYGDLVPRTDEGRAFTAVYALLGIAIIVQEFTPFVEMVLGSMQGFLPPVRRPGSPAAYLNAVAVPLVFFALGALLGHLQGQSWADAFYYSTITLTTVGFGDFTPAGPLQKCAAIVFLPLSTAALANGVSSLVELARA